MRRIVALVVAVSMVGGCATRQEGRVFAVVGGIGLGVGIALAATGEENAETPFRGALTALVVLVSLPLLIGGLVGISRGDAQRREELALKAKEEDRRAKARSAAFALLERAQARSEASDCKAVAKIGADVELVDAEFYANVFVMDAVIKRCLPFVAPIVEPVNEPPTQAGPVAEPPAQAGPKH